MPEVKQERTSWRDEGLSQRHRLWGFDCPVVDIDCLMLEYNHAQPVALVEYKNEHAKIELCGHSSFKAITELANRADIYFFMVFYSDDYSKWKVVPMNSKAKNLSWINSGITMDEEKYVSMLYWLRGQQMPEHLRATLRRGQLHKNL